VYDRGGDLVQTLQAPVPTVEDGFGHFVYSNGDFIAVSDASSVNGLDSAGRVYLFGKGSLTFDLSSLIISPSPVKEGEIVSISCDVTNTGTVSGSHIVTLKINGEVVDEKTVSLDSDGSEKVSFEVLCENVGEFDVDVNGETASYKVTKAQTGIPGFPIMSILAALAIYYLFREFGK
jgi:hypothetical protein